MSTREKSDKNLSSGGRSPAKSDRNHVQLKSKNRLHYGVKQSTRIKAGFLDDSNISRMVTNNLILAYFDRKVAEIGKYFILSVALKKAPVPFRYAE
jgi:hypothetical protein